MRSADAVHTPLPGDIPLIGMCVALAMRKPLLVRYGGSWARNDGTTIMNTVTRSCMRLFAGGRNVMLATGEENRAPASRISWIFSTALTADELRAIRPSLDRGLASPPRLTYAGRLSEEKGVANLIRAVAQMRDQGFSPLPLVTIAGGGPERGTLEDLTRSLALEGVVRFVGQLNRRDLSALFSQSDLCVQPSLSEGFSKAWLDAMAHGVPVITSRVGAAVPVIGADGARGWIVEPGDVGQLAHTINNVLSGPVDWPALRRRCRSYTESRTLEAWTEQIGQACARSWNCSIWNGKLRQA
jgi:glycosyltransferase involved in cell wall biosynthesis